MSTMVLQSNYNAAQFSAGTAEEFKGGAVNTNQTIPADLVQDSGLAFRPLCSLIAGSSN